MVLKATFSIKDTVKFAKDIGNEAVRALNSTIRASKNEMLADVRDITSSLLKRSKFFNDLVSGSILRGELGIPSGEQLSRMNAIIDQLVSEIELNITPLKFNGGKINGGIQILIGPGAWESLVTMAEATIVTGDGTELEWLRWVLKKGDQIIVAGYDVEFGLNYGRSGVAIMVESLESGWRVPPAYSGTTNDNFITREFKRNLDLYIRIINNTLKRRLSERFK